MHKQTFSWAKPAWVGISSSNFTMQDLANLSTAGMLLGSPTEQSEQWT
jgi:hypothetical protein